MGKDQLRPASEVNELYHRPWRTLALARVELIGHSGAVSSAHRGRACGAMGTEAPLWTREAGFLFALQLRMSAKPEHVEQADQRNANKDKGPGPEQTFDHPSMLI